MSVLDDCRCAAIVGLGLVGGSLARDLSVRGVRVLAYDADPTSLQAAIDDGVVSAGLDETFSDAAQADLIVIAVPVDCAPDVLHRIVAHGSSTALITDVGSTKTRIVKAAESFGIGSQFVGSHPMAGDHRSGWGASRAGMFSNARVYLCAADTVNDGFIERATRLWQTFGAKPMRISADEHDRKLARASHLPHVLSAALGVSLARDGVSRADLGPGGRDVTRLAGSSPDLWTAIARENSAALEVALADAEREIASFRRALTAPAADELRSYFAAARTWFDEGL